MEQLHRTGAIETFIAITNNKRNPEALRMSKTTVTRGVSVWEGYEKAISSCRLG